MGSHQRRRYHDSPIEGGEGPSDNVMVPYINKAYQIGTGRNVLCAVESGPRITTKETTVC